MVEHGRFTRIVYARVAPNEDIVAAAEKVALEQAIRTACVRGSLGSLTDACLERPQGRTTEIRGPAVEVLSLTGEITSDADGSPRADLVAVVGDSAGHVHAGRLVSGRNPVLVTFELALEVWEPD